MSKDLNKVQLTGRLGQDPEIRITPQGSTVTTFSVASNRSYKTGDGEARDDTEWFSVVAWNKLGEICGEYLRKGSRVYVEGRLQTRSWEDQESGQKRFKTEVIASDMIMLDTKPRQEESLPPEPPMPSSARQTSKSAPVQPAQPAPAPRGATPRRPVKPVYDEDDLPF
jgi:single-strand DNA-binding protein